MKNSIRSEVRDLVKQALAAELAGLFGKLLTVQDVCSRLQCCERTFYRRRRHWRFPVPIIAEGNCIRWTPKQIEIWETQRQNVRPDQTEKCS